MKGSLLKPLHSSYGSRATLLGLSSFGFRMYNHGSSAEKQRLSLRYKLSRVGAFRKFNRFMNVCYIAP